MINIINIQLSNRILSKTCSKCYSRKPLYDFYTKSANKDGLRNSCKYCDQEYQKMRRIEQAELINTQRKIARNRRIEEVREIARNYYKEHSDKIKLQSHESYLRNKENILERNRQYSKTEIGKISIKNTRHKRRVQINSSFCTKEELVELIKNSTTCYWCNNILNNYHIDHFYPLSKGGTHTIDNIVIACPSCNLQKSDKDPYEFAKIIGKEL